MRQKTTHEAAQQRHKFLGSRRSPESELWLRLTRRLFVG